MLLRLRQCHFEWEERTTVRVLYGYLFLHKTRYHNRCMARHRWQSYQCAVSTKVPGVSSQDYPPFSLIRLSCYSLSGEDLRSPHRAPLCSTPGDDAEHVASLFSHLVFGIFKRILDYIAAYHPPRGGKMSRKLRSLHARHVGWGSWLSFMTIRNGGSSVGSNARERIYRPSLWSYIYSYVAYRRAVRNEQRVKCTGTNTSKICCKIAILPTQDKAHARQNTSWKEVGLTEAWSC